MSPVLKTLGTFVRYAGSSFEFWLLVVVLLGGLFWSGTPSGRSFWGDAACNGHLFPGHIEDGVVVKPGIEGPDQQRAAFSFAAWRIGFDLKEGLAIGEAASIACNEGGKGRQQ